MLKEHLKRNSRIVRPRPSLSPSKRKGTHWVVYMFLCIVLAIILILLLVTYDFSIHQPNITDRPANEQKDVIIDGSTSDMFQKLMQDISNLKIENKSSNDVSMAVSHRIKIEKWPLETENGGDCAGVFGNGFRREIISCATNLSQFKCVQNPFSQQMYCNATNLIINPQMIQVSDGGESIAAVSGRNEGDEFPKFKHDSNTGETAFSVDCKPEGNVPKKDGISYFFSDIINFMRNIEGSVFHSKYISDHTELCNGNGNDKLTIFLVTMRYEYANMYHQATDWYNFYQIIHSLNIESYDYEIIFLDGHAQSKIDDAWQYGINAKYNFIKTLNSGKPLCLQNAIFVSAGYVGGISLRTVFQKCRTENKYVMRFGEWFLKGFGLQFETQRKSNNISITLTCRKDYVAHPRNMIGRASRKFANDFEVEQRIREIVSDIEGTHFHIRNVAWSDYSFKEQLRIAASTDILIGVHGAGLSHVLFLPPKSGLIEIVPSGFDAEPHFQAFAQWCGHRWIHVPGGNENRVNPNAEKFANAIKDQVRFMKNNINV